MLRLDRTVSRKLIGHHDQDAEDRAYWETRTPEQRQEILDFLRQQAHCLYAFARSNPNNKNLPDGEWID